MSRVDDVVAETGASVGDVLAACRRLGIVASSPTSGLSRAEHEALRSALGAPADLPPVVAGSTSRMPDAAPAPDTRSLQERHDALVAEHPRRRRAPTARIVRWVVLGSLVVMGIVTVVAVQAQGDGSGARVLRFTTADEGACVDLDDGGPAQVVVVGCAAAHDAELFAVVDLATDPVATTLDAGPDDAHPGIEALVGVAEVACPARFATHVGRAHDDSALDIVYLVPTPPTWSVGDRSLLCLAEDPAGPLLGPVAGSDR